MATATAPSAAQRPRSITNRGARILASFARMHPLPFGVAVAGATLYAATTVASTVVLGRITDAVLVPAFAGRTRTPQLVAGVAAIGGVALVRAGAIATRRYFAGMTVHRSERSLRLRVLGSYAALPLAFHRCRPTGELLAHTQADIEAACATIGPLPYATAVVSLIVFAAIAMVVTDPVLALLGCTTLPALALLNRVYAQRIEEPQTRVQERIGDVSSVAHESIDGALVVKTMGREADEVERFAAAVDALRAERVRAGLLRAGFEPALEALPDATMILLLALGSWRASTGAISTGALVEFVSLFQLLAFPMRVIGFVLGDLPRSVVGRERLETVFTEHEEAARPPAAPARHPRESSGARPCRGAGLRARGVRVALGGAEVLRGVDLDVAPGETVAIVGSTGCGKSTLAELLVRLADPDAGSVAIDGTDLRDLDAAALRGATAIVLQESFLFATTVRENIALGAAVDAGAIEEAARIAQAHAFVERMVDGYDTVLGERGLTVSGGQRQRIAIARALVRRPRLLVLDDATSAVDPTVEAAILAGLRGLTGTTVVMVANRPSTIAIADRAVLIEDGTVSAAGPHAELMSLPRYEALIRAAGRGPS
ncbi:MAG TPA: ABC transporter ATP-binding protein [Candidatus Dormibacteraeota bacterium]|nr:ABC transporter ATP-binding protein [Candidatus Dormibacteraeota bacterium]